MSNPHDVTIDIPLTATASRGQNGARKWGSHTGSTVPINGFQDDNEKEPMRGPGRRRRQDSDINEATGKPADSPEDGSINRMGRIYQAIYNFSIVTRYMIYVVPIGILIAIPIIVGATVATNARIGGVHISWFFTWIEVVWVSLWACKIFTKFIPYVFQFLCGIVSSGTRKYALILRALETPITIVLWSVISLVTFLPIMTMNPSKQSSDDTSVKSWEKSVKNILFALLVCSLIYLVEKALVQLISISYHRKQFDAKIKQSKHNVYLVGLLFEASRNMFPMYCPEFKDEDAIIFDSLLAQSAGKQSKRSSIMPLRMMQQVGRQVGHNVGRIGDKVTAAFGNVASELTGKQVFNPQATHSIVVEALERKRCAAALARRIWMSFVVEGRDSLYLEDIVEVLGPDHEAEAEECFAALDKDGNGDVSLDEMILTISEFGRMRKSLNHSMHDVDQAIHVLDNLLLSVASVIGVLVFISFVTTGFGTVIAAGATSLLSLSFVFSTTAQEVLGSCIFLFVKHPFDIGDRVDISDKSYVVERISLLFSVFRTVGDHRMTQVPNNILNSLWIDNFTRANAMHEQLTVPVSFDTSFAEIQALREEMEVFVRDPANSRDFQPDFNIEVVGVGDMDKLELSVDIRHKSNWSNETVRAARRSKFMCALVLAMRKVSIRAPGVAAPEEESKDDGDDKADGAPGAGDQAGAAAGADGKRDGSGQAGGLTPAAAAAASGMMAYDAQTTGFEQNRSSGSVTHRGSLAAGQREAAIADRLNARSPVVPAVDPSRDDGDGLYRTATNTSNQGKQLSVYDGNTGVSRGLSTGHRKAGLRASYQEDDAAMPPPHSPMAAGMNSSYSGVPILNTPAPPSSRGSTRYEPPISHAPTSQPGAHPIGSFAQSYYGHESTYDSVPLNGITPDRATASSSQYDMPDRYDPVSPPSIYSPPQPQAPAPTLKKGRKDSPYGEHEA
ncbi:serine/threonine protein kinase [Penicillium brasilianum]|uniref:Serine/threonine protein kinase n=1 Tax=Penicillium brasilianum TaxID=104259 RepID=A0A1S9R9Z6_PENBI|nr:serine/threonine protein kinase [Penicillium brasilianum]